MGCEPGGPGGSGGMAEPGGGTGATPPIVGSGVGGASANSWWGRSAWDSGFWAASSRSAADPCRSPLESFLNAYEMEMALLHKYWPFIASIAASEASKLA